MPKFQLHGLHCFITKKYQEQTGTYLTGDDAVVQYMYMNVYTNKMVLKLILCNTQSMES